MSNNNPRPSGAGPMRGGRPGPAGFRKGGGAKDAKKTARQTYEVHYRPK